MLRKILCAVVALTLCVGGIQAAEIKGKTVKYDTDKKVLVVDVEGKETEVQLSDETKIITQKNEPDKQGLKRFTNPKFKFGGKVVITTETKEGKDVATELKFEKKAK